MRETNRSIETTRYGRDGATLRKPVLDSVVDFDEWANKEERAAANNDKIDLDRPVYEVFVANLEVAAVRSRSAGALNDKAADAEPPVENGDRIGKAEPARLEEKCEDSGDDGSGSDEQLSTSRDEAPFPQADSRT